MTKNELMEFTQDYRKVAEEAIAALGRSTDLNRKLVDALQDIADEAWSHYRNENSCEMTKALSLGIIAGMCMKALGPKNGNSKDSNDT